MTSYQMAVVLLGFLAIGGCYPATQHRPVVVQSYPPSQPYYAVPPLQPYSHGMIGCHQDERTVLKLYAPVPMTTWRHDKADCTWLTNETRRFYPDLFTSAGETVCTELSHVSEIVSICVGNKHVLIAATSSAHWASIKQRWDEIHTTLY